MRRVLLCLVLSGCFSEGPDDHVAGTTLPMTTSAQESSSSSDGTSSSSEDSSSSESFDPLECPDWCTGGCDDILGAYTECRCRTNYDCTGGGLHCDVPDGGFLGHCR